MSSRSYWAFVATECLARAIKVYNPTKPLKILSAQQLIDGCKPNESNVYAYSVDATFLYIEQNGNLEKEKTIKDGRFTGKKKKNFHITDQ